MKRIAVGAVSALALLAPMIATPSYAGQGAAGAYVNAQSDRGDRNTADQNRGAAPRVDRRADAPSNNNDRQINNDRGNDRDSRDYRNGDNRSGNDPRGNDYSRNDNNRGNVYAGHRDWRRGDRLPSYYRSQYREVNYRDRGWRQPPRGYHYVRDDRGNALLVGIATGAILSVILSQ